MLLKYVWRSFRSRLGEKLVLTLIVFLCLLLILFLNNMVSDRQTELDDVYENTEIACVVTDAAGSVRTGLEIPAEYLLFFDEGGVLHDHVNRLSCHADASILLLGEERIPLHLLNTPSAVPLFDETPITYFAGGSAEDLAGQEAVGIIAESLMPYVMEDGTLTLDFPPQREESMTIRVIGTYPSEAAAIYLSLDAGRKLLENSRNIITLSSLSFCVADNRKLNETKLALSDYFIAADPINQGSARYGLLMDDASFVDEVTVLERSIALFALFRTVLLILSVGICCLVNFLLIRRRRTELAVMHSLGCRADQIYGQMLCEQIICFVVGAFAAGALGTVLDVSLHGEVYRSIGVLFCGYLIGTVISVAAVTSGDIMKVLKGKE